MGGQISLFNTLFYVSLAVAALGLGFAIFFFFFFDIRSVHARLTGRAKEKTIRKMLEQNAKTGNLRPAPMFHTGPTGQTGETSGPIIKQPKTARTKPTKQTEEYETVVLQSSESGQTAPLSVEMAPDYVQGGQQMPSDIGFELSENTVLIHTDEII